MEPLTYVMTLRATSARGEFYMDHRLPMFPGQETVVALKEETERMFEGMFGEPVEEWSVSLCLSEPEETETEGVETYGE